MQCCPYSGDNYIVKGFPCECHVEQPADPEKCVAATKRMILNRKLGSCNDAPLQTRSMKRLRLFSLLDSGHLCESSACNDEVNCLGGALH